MTSNVRGAVATRAAPVTTQFQFGPWSLKAVKSHILESEGAARERFGVLVPFILRTDLFYMASGIQYIQTT